MQMAVILGGLLEVGLLCTPISLMAQQSPTNPRPAAQQTKLTTEQLADMKKEIESLKARVSELERAKNDLQTRLLKVELSQNANQSVLLDFTSHEFQKLDSSAGTFLISFADATPYLDGYKVTLNLGNPSFATFTGFKLKLRWNTKYDWTKYTSDSFIEWNQATQERELSFVDELKPGTWNKITLILPSTSNNQLGYFEVSMETNTVLLQTDTR